MAPVNSAPPARMPMIRWRRPKRRNIDDAHKGRDNQQVARRGNAWPSALVLFHDLAGDRMEVDLGALAHLVLPVDFVAVAGGDLEDLELVAEVRDLRLHRGLAEPLV